LAVISVRPVPEHEHLAQPRLGRVAAVLLHQLGLVGIGRLAAGDRIAVVQLVAPVLPAALLDSISKPRERA